MMCRRLTEFAVVSVGLLSLSCRNEIQTFQPAVFTNMMCKYAWNHAEVQSSRQHLLPSSTCNVAESNNKINCLEKPTKPAADIIKDKNVTQHDSTCAKMLG